MDAGFMHPSTQPIKRALGVILFFEFDNLEPDLTVVEDIKNVLSSDQNENLYTISGALANSIRNHFDFGGRSLNLFKNCSFSFSNGELFAEIDSNGVLNIFSNVVPEWFVSSEDIEKMRWLKNHDLHELITPDFLHTLRLTCSNDLSLANVLLKDESELSLTKNMNKRGNKFKKSTAAKVDDMKSYELFIAFFIRLEECVFENEFPKMENLVGSSDLSNLPAKYKRSVRTWFKGITGVLPPNNKKIIAGNPILFCAPIKERLEKIRAMDLKDFYFRLSKSIEESECMKISDFDFFTKR